VFFYKIKYKKTSQCKSDQITHLKTAQIIFGTM